MIHSFVLGRHFFLKKKVLKLLEVIHRIVLIQVHHEIGNKSKLKRKTIGSNT